MVKQRRPRYGSKDYGVLISPSEAMSAKEERHDEHEALWREMGEAVNNGSSGDYGRRLKALGYDGVGIWELWVCGREEDGSPITTDDKGYKTADQIDAYIAWLHEHAKSGELAQWRVYGVG